ncbi:hypothetical protein, partial [Duganella sp. Root198D2]
MVCLYARPQRRASAVASSQLQRHPASRCVCRIQCHLRTGKVSEAAC